MDSELREQVARILGTNWGAIPLKDRPIEGTADWHINQIMKLIAASNKALLLRVPEALGYHFETAHPADCECHEFDSDTVKDGYWKDGDFVSVKDYKQALAVIDVEIEGLKC